MRTKTEKHLCSPTKEDCFVEVLLARAPHEVGYSSEAECLQGITSSDVLVSFSNVTREERISLEQLPPSDWPVGMF